MQSVGFKPRQNAVCGFQLIPNGLVIHQAGNDNISTVNRFSWRIRSLRASTDQFVRLCGGTVPYSQIKAGG